MLLPLRQHFVGDRNRHVGRALGKDLLDQKLVLGRQIGVHQHHGDGFDLAIGDHLVRDRPDLRLIELLDDRARRANSFVDLQCVAALDERLRLDPGEIVMVAAVAAADERNVAEAARRQVSDHRAFAFEQRVGRDGRAEAD